MSYSFRSSVRSSHRVLAGAAVACALAASTQAATFVISETTSLFTPSFRGDANTTYFAWNSGSWDGNDDTTSFDVINSVPPLTGAAPSNQGRIYQNSPGDIVSGSNNIYSGSAGQSLTLIIPTNGTPGNSTSGSTTIIIQGFGLSGAAFGGDAGGMDTLVFGTIGGVEAEYIGGVNTGGNAAGATQFWAKFSIPGNLPQYSVDVSASQTGLGVLSLTDLSVDTYWTPDVRTYAPDIAVVVVPEPASAVLGLAALSLLARRRRPAVSRHQD